MTIEDKVFKKCTPDFKKLIEYGFKEINGKFTFKKLFKDDEFRAEINISKSGKVSGKVIEVENNEEFLPLRVENQQGTFVGTVREEYTNLLKNIRENCFSENYFVFPQSNRITKAIISEYGDNPDFMWERFSDYGVFKNADNNKWYGIIMNIDYSKLGEDNKKPVEIINLKLDKEEIQELLKQNGFYPAWHMNKKSWITVALDERIEDKTILKLVAQSYSYTVNKKTRVNKLL